MTQKPLIWWVRRDLRLRDNPALTEAARDGRPVIPVFIRDAIVDGTGAAARWRWGLGLAAFDAALREKGSRLIFRAGNPRDVLETLVDETGAEGVVWSRLYDPDSIARDTDVKSALKARDLRADSFAGHLCFEPWEVETQQGGFYKVYSPMWRAVKDREVADCLPVPHKIAAPEAWPESDDLADWALGRAMRRGADVVKHYVCVGEHEALLRLDRFLDSRIDAYKEARDHLAADATSGLSENLTYGEISPRRLWHEGRKHSSKGAEHFVKEVVWREFAYHLLYHQPKLAEENFREEWNDFTWRADNADAEAWRKGLTGVNVVDAAMRELYTTGVMHNRCRMIVGSYLTKHLLTDWRVGLRWFEDTLIDWDPASNAMGWQWIAGCGPDAAPYFRVFNPETQAEKFDESGEYRRLYLHGGARRNGRDPTVDFYDAIPKSWAMSPDDPRPKPLIDLKDGRDRALAAYAELKR